MADFKINRTIKEEDVPPQAEHRKSMYDPIATSARTLEVGEGIEVDVEKPNVVQHIKRIIQKRLPRRAYEVTGRSRPSGYKVYVIRKS